MEYFEFSVASDPQERRTVPHDQHTVGGKNNQPDESPDQRRGESREEK